MPTLTVRTNRINSVTFVEAILETAGPCRARLETCFDGAVWPPRSNGTVVDGWDDDGVTIEVDAGTTAIGFATPAIASDRPIELVRSEPREPSGAGIEAWIERIERRVESAEALATVEDVSAAADAVAAVGGLANVEALAGEIDRDRRIAARVSIIPKPLRERLERVNIPSETFAALVDEKRRN